MTNPSQQRPAGGGFNNGDVVFFKKAKKGSHRKNPEVTFKGHAFGVLLGHVPPFQKDPPPEHLLRLMGTIGFLTFDMVAEFLGDEHAQTCVKKFEDKFYGKIVEGAAQPPPEQASDGVASEAPGESDEGIQKPGLQLVDSRGAPLQSPREPEVEQ